MTQNLLTTFNDRKVKEVFGSHKLSRTNDDVKQIYVRHQNVPYLPLNLGEFFPNLEILYVTKSNVQHLITGDLDGLEDLKTFDVSHNPVEFVNKDFFKGQNKLERISFYDCHVKKVENGAFAELKSLGYLYFDQNPCIDIRFDGQNSYESPEIEEVVANIYDKCTGLNHTLRTTTACHSIRNEELILESTTEMWHKVLMIFLVITLFLNVIFGFLFVRIYRRNFSGNWVEMKNVLI